MNFAEWLQNELNKRRWSHTDLARHIKKVGYQVSRPQITHILNEERNASAEVCIAIAHGLGVPRETIFQARGWLPYESESSGRQLSSETAVVAFEIDNLPPHVRRTVLRTAQTMAESLRKELAGWQPPETTE